MSRRDISEVVTIMLEANGRPRPITKKRLRELRELGEGLAREQRRAAARKILQQLPQPSKGRTPSS